MLILITIIILAVITNYVIGLSMKGLDNPPITRYEQEQEDKLRTDIDWNSKGVRHTRRSLALKAEGEKKECEMIRAEMEEWQKQQDEEKRLRCLEATRAMYDEIEAAAVYGVGSKLTYSANTPVCFKDGKRVNTSPAPQLTKKQKKTVVNNKDTRKKANQIKAISNIIKPGRDGLWIYLMSDGQRLKVGISNNPKRRLREIRNLSGKPVKILALCTTSNKRTLDTEQDIHHRLKDINTPYKYKDGVISKEWHKHDLNRILEVLEEECNNVKLTNEAIAA